MSDPTTSRELLQSLPEPVRDELRHFLGEYEPGDWKRSSGLTLLRTALALYQESQRGGAHDYEQRLARTYSEVLLALAQLVFYQATPVLRLGIEGHVANELERWRWGDGQDQMLLVEEDDSEPAS